MSVVCTRCRSRDAVTRRVPLPALGSAEWLCASCFQQDSSWTPLPTLEEMSRCAACGQVADAYTRVDGQWFCDSCRITAQQKRRRQWPDSLEALLSIFTTNNLASREVETRRRLDAVAADLEGDDLVEFDRECMSEDYDMAGREYVLVARYQSRSRPDRTYEVKRDADGQLSCNCPAWLYKADGERECKHVFKALVQLKIDAQGLQQETPNQIPTKPAKPAPHESRRIDYEAKDG